ncbi:MAG: hypothetical protein HY071_00495 [Chloroflexi bacterium]|nr:hypothetical protein [Chloroflexota bacterium]
MIVELDEAVVALLPRRHGFRRAALLMTLLLVAIVPLIRDEPLPVRRLHMPDDAQDVELTWLPDRLANEPPPASVRIPVSIRGTTGLASVDETVAIVLWTERGIAYRLLSDTRSVGDLVLVAARLR